MKGIVVQFRRGAQKYKPRHFLIQAEGVANKKDAEKLKGKAVEWKSPAGRIVKGMVSETHGNKGLLRVIFEKGLPGQAVINTDEVEIK